MLSLIEAKVENGENFAFETTLSGLNYARRIPRWREAGYYVKLIFLSLPSADLAVARVRGRVHQGGHDIPEPVIRRRFDAGLQNFNNVYRPLVDGWVLYDNSDSPPRPIAQGGTLL
jgi:predicted ABC-type ATPase